MKYRSITYLENQKLATDLLRKFGISAKNDLPIDPEILLRRMRIPIIPSSNLKRNFGIKGCVVKYSDELQILIDEYHYENEEESSLFTLGEELGHCVLHLTDIDKVKSIHHWMKLMEGNSSYHREIHQQARLFSSNIILPGFAFSGYVGNWVKQNLADLKRFISNSENGLADNIAFLMEDDLRISQWIISIALIRYPDRAIDRIAEDHPDLLDSRRSG